MPYQETSPLAAGIGMASGWLAGQQQAKQYAQQQANIKQQQDLEAKRQAAEQAYQSFDINERTRARQMAEGKDPDTGQAITSELPKNLQVGISPKASLQAQYDKNMKVAAFFLARGFKDQAAPYLDAAQTAATQMNQEVMFRRDLQKAVIVGNLETDRLLTGINARGTQQSQRDADNERRRFGDDMTLKGQPTYADLHPRPGSARSGVPTFNSVNSMLGEWAQGSQTQIGTNTVRDTKGNPQAVPIYGRKPPTPDAKNYMYSAVTAIQQDKNPMQAAAHAVAVYKKEFGNDAQAVRILQEAGAQAAGPPAPPNP